MHELRSPRALVSFERVFEVLDLVPLIRERPDASTVPDGPGHRRIRLTSGSPTPLPTRCHWPRSKRSPRLDDRGGDEVLHGISFTARPGQMVALVGSSGAGKSTSGQHCWHACTTSTPARSASTGSTYAT